MTVTAEQAKAMLDDRTPTTRLINEAYEGGLLVELDIEARHHANSVQQLAATVVELYERLAIVESVQQLAATVVELYERLAIVESERDKLARWKAEAKIVIAGWNQVWEDSGRPGALGESTSAATAKHIERLQAAIDKQDERCSLPQGESDDLRSRIAEVLALHYVIMDNPRGGPVRPCCIVCEESYPCPTYVALTQGGEG